MTDEESDGCATRIFSAASAGAEVKKRRGRKSHESRRALTETILKIPPLCFIQPKSFLSLTETRIDWQGTTSIPRAEQPRIFGNRAFTGVPDEFGHADF
jgi:hypothetical protein